MKKAIIIITVFTSILFSSCLKNCSDTTYSFDIYAKIFPDKDSIEVGDTTWVEVSTPTTLMDKISNKTVDYSGAENMSVAIQMYSLHPETDTDAGSSYATTDFNYVLEAGSLYTADQYAMNYLYEEINNTYHVKVGFIPKDTGTYRLYVSDAVNVYRKKHKCDKVTYAMSYMAGTDQHLYLFHIVKPDYEPDGIGAHYSYCFKVY